MIKHLKKDMLDQFNLSDYHVSIQQEIKNTEAFRKILFLADFADVAD